MVSRHWKDSIKSSRVLDFAKTFGMVNCKHISKFADFKNM